MIKNLRLLCTLGFVSALVSLAQAGPGAQYWQSLRTEADFSQLKAGDKVGLVCTECKSVSEIAITSPAQAMELCKVGAKVDCPVCKKSFKVVPTKTTRNEPSTKTEVSYVNDKGEDCAFVVKLPHSH